MKNIVTVYKKGTLLNRNLYYKDYKVVMTCIMIVNGTNRKSKEIKKGKT